ncbi:seryl-tRNA synthetase synthetase [Diaporthe helianthi]|uniref:serine--tRNA ligase n=1 Tax=Diaporthe helianthi TaxID=158607 RepID=A0A2P5HU66_DIAHE|nr:seryl-tRNA synthetase synthetase [Diaporthe helianthi]
MKTARRGFTCLRCRLSLSLSNTHSRRPLQSSSRLRSSEQTLAAGRPTIAPKPTLDIKHIRQNPALYQQTCLERNYKAQAEYPARIIALHDQWQSRQHDGRALRERSNLLRRQIANPSSSVSPDEQDGGGGGDQATNTNTPTPAPAPTRDELLLEARRLKQQLASIEHDEDRLQADMHALALALPNLTGPEAPRGDRPAVLSYINDHPEPRPSSSDRVWRSHVHIGSELGILDFAAAATSSGWGWYYLLGDGAQLEHALVSYALDTARRFGWAQVSPPSVVYSHIASACGFQPRDQHGETQVYTLRQSPRDKDKGRPELSLAATAEIPLAAMRADSVLDEADLPTRRAAVSRCYRAEAGARGADTKGLYRVHEFTKVELFAWTPPDPAAAADVFDEMLDMQTEILGSLGLHCRILEMPTADLGASAARKNDIEVWFPSRARRDTAATHGNEGPAASADGAHGDEKEEEEGWGEVTSASICTDYQTRRLATRVRIGGSNGKMAYPWTVNGTALAVPRVLAAILETGWDEGSMTVTIPEVLRPWMDGKETISPKTRTR